jgi:photosystem II stability/assembly factor-like uncharacterized protein
MGHRDSSGGCLFESLDGGRSWKEVPLALGGLPLCALAVLALATPTPVLLAVTPDGIGRSTDGGATWAAVSAGFFNSSAHLRSAPSDPSVVYSVLGNSNGPAATMQLRRSDDAGATWSAPISVGPSIADLAVDPRDPLVVYGIGSLGFFRTGDGGATVKVMYSPVATAGSGNRIVTVSARRAGTVVVVPNGGKAMESADGGASWTPVPGLEDATVGSVMFDPRDPDVLYARTLGGLFRTTRP